jgi:hypothetical protein
VALSCSLSLSLSLSLSQHVLINTRIGSYALHVSLLVYLCLPHSLVFFLKKTALLQSNGFDLFHTESREGRANSWPLTAVSSSHGTAIAAVKTGWVRRRGGRVAEEEEGDEAAVEGGGHALRGGVGLERIVSAEGLASAQRAPAQI